MASGTDHVVENEGELIRIELRLDGSSPTGRATAFDGATRAFTGWVGLMSAVDALVAGEADTSDRSHAQNDRREPPSGAPRTTDTGEVAP